MGGRLLEAIFLEAVQPKKQLPFQRVTIGNIPTIQVGGLSLM